MKKFYLGVILLILTNTLLIAQVGSIQLDAKGASIDDVVSDIIIDQDIYNNKTLTLLNVVYPYFGFTKPIYANVRFAIPWVKDTETVRFNTSFDQNTVLYTNKFEFIFHPIETDREARRQVLTEKDRYFTRPVTITNLTGKFLVNTGKVSTAYFFFVQSFEIIELERKYVGTVPMDIR
jgi:hypothetical protein